MRTRIVATVALVLATSVAWADIVHLKSGGRVEGKIVETTDNKVVVEKATGMRLSVPMENVARIEKSESPYERYLKEVADAEAAGTAEAYMKLAEWSRESRLGPEERSALEKVIALDPDHEEARARLGYQRHDGTWMTAEAIREARAPKDNRGRSSFSWHEEAQPIHERIRANERQIAERRAQIADNERQMADLARTESSQVAEAQRGVLATRNQTIELEIAQITRDLARAKDQLAELEAACALAGCDPEWLDGRQLEAPGSTPPPAAPAERDATDSPPAESSAPAPEAPPAAPTEPGEPEAEADEPEATEENPTEAPATEE